MYTSKISTVDDLALRGREQKASGKRTVFAINSDQSVRRIKGEKRPIFNERERSEILVALEMVDFVTIFGEDTPLETILKLRPDVLVKGADWEEKGIVGQEQVEGWGGEVVPIRLLEGQSTSGIIDRIVSGIRTGRAG
jgi:rfaE bifunctional protein nucleotidyltransferase chain/domain